MSKVKTPQEKKRLSYEKDRRNSYGENDKSSRKSIPKNKRSRVHAERSKERILKQIVSASIDNDSVLETESKVVSETKLKRRKGFRKYPDQTLKEHIAQQQRKRTVRYGRRKNS